MFITRRKQSEFANMYLYISSNDCLNLYPSNTATDFIVELPQAITGTHLSLHHVYFNTKNPNLFQQRTPDEYYYVLCDLVETSVLDGKESHVLGSFFQKGILMILLV